ncbi:MAG: flagellar basal body P-ring formation chaperone FlgA [Xanthobacteraceae bacterium]
MIRTLIRVFALVLLLGGAAAAQTARPALRAHVTVDSDLVRIGDLVENAGPVASIPIFRAPDLGTTGAVSTERVVEAIAPYQLIDINTRGLTDVVVTRAGRAIDPPEISATITHALSQRYSLGDPSKISLNFDLPVHTIQVEPNATGDLQVAALGYDSRTGRFNVTLSLPSSVLLEQQPVRLTGTAVEMVEGVTVNRPVDRGEVLHGADLTVVQRPKSQAAGLIRMSAAIGMEARRQLRPGQPIQASDVMMPQIVKRNDTVTLIYQAPGLTLTLRGQAQDAGALGDTIGVLNPQTKRVVQGVVSGPGQVMVADGVVHLAANAPHMALLPAAAGSERQE